MNDIVLTTKITQDEYTEAACKLYDVPPFTESKTLIKNNNWALDGIRQAHSFEDVGRPSTYEESELFWNTSLK